MPAGVGHDRRHRASLCRHWQADDGRYKLPGRKGKIGTITAFCQGVNRCPDVVNTV
ncbi:hypothetical protein GCM10010416_00230 [Streptomyces caniferus]